MLPGLVLGISCVLIAGAGCFWWLAHVPHPQWHEVILLSLLLIAVGVLAVGAAIDLAAAG